MGNLANVRIHGNGIVFIEREKARAVRYLPADPRMPSRAALASG